MNISRIFEDKKKKHTYEYCNTPHIFCGARVLYTYCATFYDVPGISRGFGKASLYNTSIIFIVQ